MGTDAMSEKSHNVAHRKLWAMLFKKVLMNNLRPLKPFHSLEEQAEKILSRNCKGEREFITEKLRYVNYYRLTGYLYPFRKRGEGGIVEEEFVEGTAFERIWELYRFDRRLRLLLLDAIERIEIGIRTCIAYRWAESCANAGISNPQGRDACYRKRKINEELLKIIQKQYDRSKDRCAIHHKEIWKILNVKDLPVWVFVEFTTFDNLRLLSKDCLKPQVAKKVASDFSFSDENKFYSMLNLLREVRNTCAHHGMIWNKPWEKESTRTPLAPDLPGHPVPPADYKKRIAYILLCCSLLLKTIIPDSAWRNRVIGLLDEISLSEEILFRMGITPNFREQLNR